MNVEIYTDGACRGNPGPGGWGVLMRYQSVEKTLKGAEQMTTNNRMELTAAIKGLEAITRDCEVDLYTDSKYVQQGMMLWIAGWKKKGWLTANKQAVKNVDLWQQLDKLAQLYPIRWHWVKGHSGHVENDRVDALANEAIDEFLGVS